MKKRDFLSLSEIPENDLISILYRADELAVAYRQRKMKQTLIGKRIAIVVNDDGWRNTVAFDLGIQALGGVSVHVPLQWHEREEIADVSAYLGNWFDAIVTRARELSIIRRVAETSNIPVINSRTRKNHPCETLGDLAYYLHKHGKLDGIKVCVICPATLVLESWVEAASTLPIEVVQVFPEQWHAAPQTSRSVGRFRTSTDMGELRDADLLVTGRWPIDVEPATFFQYQVSSKLLDSLKPTLSFVPCPPVRRGLGVTDDATAHKAYQAIQAKDYLLHAQNAVLEWTLRVDPIQ